MALKSFAELLRRAAQYARRGLSEVEARMRERHEPSLEPALVRRRGHGRRPFGPRHYKHWHCRESSTEWRQTCFGRRFGGGPFGYFQKACLHTRSRRPKHGICPFHLLKAQKRFFSYMFSGGFYSNTTLCKGAFSRGYVSHASAQPPPVWMASLFGPNHTQLRLATKKTHTVGSPTSLHHVVSDSLNSGRQPSLIRACTTQSVQLAPFFPPIRRFDSHVSLIRCHLNAKIETLVETLSKPWSVSLVVPNMWPKSEANPTVQEPDHFDLPAAPGSEATTAAVDFEVSPDIMLPNHTQLDQTAMENIVSAIEAQITRLRNMARDVRQISELGELPISVENNGRTLRVHFPNSNPESIDFLMQDQEIQTARIVELPSDNLDVPPIAPVTWEDSGTAPQLSFSISTATTVSESFSLV